MFLGSMCAFVQTLGEYAHQNITLQHHQVKNTIIYFFSPTLLDLKGAVMFAVFCAYVLNAALSICLYVIVLCFASVPPCSTRGQWLTFVLTMELNVFLKLYFTL